MVFGRNQGGGSRGFLRSGDAEDPPATDRVIGTGGQATGGTGGRAGGGADGDGSSGAVGRDRNDESRRFLRCLRALAILGYILIFLYSLRCLDSWKLLSIPQVLRVLGVGMLISGASLLSGFVLGFIFAIPRLGDEKKKQSGTAPGGTLGKDSGSMHDSVPQNANLVEISDWLTKIIVGVGLVELKAIPGELGKWAYYLAPALLSASNGEALPGTESLASGQAAGLAIIIYYFALGFLWGYVWTMIYFQRDLMGEVDELKQKKGELEQQKAVLAREKEALERQEAELKRQKEEETRLKEVEQRLKEIEKRLKQAADRRASAEIAVNQKKYTEALDSIDKALELFTSIDKQPDLVALFDEVPEKDKQYGFAKLTKARILKRMAVESGEPDRGRLLTQAIQLAGESVALLPENGEPFYNKACYQALLNVRGLRSEVFESLKSAFRLDPGLRAVAKKDPDLELLWEDADFIRLTSEAQPPDR